VDFIYAGQERGRLNLDDSGALKAVGAGWLMCALADVGLMEGRVFTPIGWLMKVAFLAGLDPLSYF
jgi:hypothetical protein